LSRRAPAEGLAVRLYAALAILLMFAPVLVMIRYSLNDSGTRFNYVLHRFSVDAWMHPLDVPQLGLAIRNSLTVAVIASLLAVLLGTPFGYALGRYRFRGKSMASSLTFLPLATPEIVMGAGLLTVSVASASTAPFKTLLPEGLLYPLGMVTVVIAHATLGLSFVIINVRARVDRETLVLEEAAKDLGAIAPTVFRTIWLPALWPGVVSGGLLVFAISLDDFVLTNFTAGSTVMFPTWAYGLLRRELPPQVDVVGVMMFAVSLVAVIAAGALGRRRGVR